MTVLDLTASWLSVFVEPGDALAIAVTVPAGSESGTWLAKVYADERRGTALATMTSTVLALVVNLELTSAQVAALVPTGLARFTGHWDLTRTVAGATHTWLKGDFVVAAGRVLATTGGGL